MTYEDERGYLDTAPFLDYCVRVARVIGKTPKTTGEILAKVGNQLQLQDALDSLSGAGEVERVQLGARSGYRKAVRREIRTRGYNGWERT
jgi:hypothetical protein